MKFFYSSKCNQIVMESLRRKINALKGNQNRNMLAVIAALDASMKANVSFGVQLIVLFELVALFAEKLSEAAELLPFIKSAIDELSVACFKRDCEKHGIEHALILYRATIVSCESMKAMMSSKDFMVAISIIPCMCRPQYYEAVRDTSVVAGDRLTCKFDAMTREQSVMFACIEICLAVQNVLCK